jgi:hypothetical protein
LLAADVPAERIIERIRRSNYIVLPKPPSQQ